MTKPLLTAAFALLLPLPLCSAEEAAPRTVELADGALRFTAPAAWDSVPPRSRILEAELAVPAPEGSESGPARLTIMRAGGGVQQNLARWSGQFQPADGRGETVTFEVDGMRVTVLDQSGTYLESSRGPFGPKTPRPDYRLIGAIVETDSVGQYFFKLIGPAETVDAAKEPFRAMLESLGQAQ